MKVMCVIPVLNYLTQGKVYDVSRHSTQMIEVAADDGKLHSFLNSSFTVLQDISPILRPTDIAKPTPHELDDEEEKCWRALMPRIEKDECKCGIKRIMCDYHRDC